MSEEMNEQQKLQAEIEELLNQLKIKLANVKDVEVDDNDYSEGYSNVARFKDDDGVDKLSHVKVVVDALLSDLQSTNKYSRDSEKMARAYYTSFCNA